MPFVEIDQPRPHVTRVTLNRPDRKNAMAFDVMVPLREALDEISTDNDCRVVILTGAGSAFCAGADLEDPGLVPHMDGLTVPKIARRAMRVLASSHGLLGPYDTKNALFRSETNNVRKGWGVGWRARAVVRKRRARGEAVR